MKMYLDAVPRIELESGVLKVDVIRSEDLRPLCQHIINKHEILKGYLWFDHFSYFVYRRTRHYKSIRSDYVYELLDVPFDPSKYLDNLYLYFLNEWDGRNSFTILVRDYLFGVEPIIFLLSVCMDCGSVGFCYAEGFTNWYDYLIFDKDNHIWEIGSKEIFTVSKVMTIDELVKERLEEMHLNYALLNRLEKGKIFEFSLHRMFRELQKIWIIKRNGDENVS